MSQIIGISSQTIESHCIFLAASFGMHLLVMHEYSVPLINPNKVQVACKYFLNCGLKNCFNNLPFVIINGPTSTYLNNKS